MKITILSLARFLEYLQAVLYYKKEISRLFNCKISDIKRLYDEINNSEFIKEIVIKSSIKRGFFDFSMLSDLRAPTLYVVSRILKPEIVVETGVCDGFSSAFILYALEKNQKGHLYSIDLPNQPGQELRQGKVTGWVIPENLRHRWTLILGSSKEKLPLLLNEIKKLDIFYHDSEHSYENMIFEFTSVIDYLKPGGILVADDITENRAFIDFCLAKSGLRSIRLFKTGIAIKSK